MEPWDLWEMFRSSQLASDFMSVSHVECGRWPLLNTDDDPGTELRFLTLALQKPFKVALLSPLPMKLRDV